MSQHVDLQGEFTWSGAIGAGGLDADAVLQRCQRLRLTGRLVLTDGERRAELLWMGGEIHESDSGDTSQEIRRWQRGTFQASQHMPDLRGQLTAGVELSGELSLGQVQRIAQLCSDFRLSADLYLERATGDRAQVRFTLGKAESAVIGGQAQTALQALSLLSVWHRGRYLVRLRPLFSQDAPEAPIFVEKRTTKGDFDVTGTIEIPVVDELRRRRAGGALPVAPSSAAASTGPEAPPASASADRTTQPIPPGTVAEARAAAPVRSAVVTQVTAGSPEPTRTALSVPPRPVWRKALVVGLVGGALAFAAVFAVLHYKRQPVADRGGSSGPAAPIAATAASAAAPDLARPPDLARGADPPDLAPAPDLALAARPPRSREAQAMFERAMRMIVEARMKKAQEAIAQLQKLSPEDPDATTLDKQSRYELGRADLVITGSGTVTVSGHGYAAPHRLRLPAGLYQVDGEVITLRDGERREVEARPR